MKLIYEDSQKIRIDKYLSEQLEQYTRSYVQKLIAEGKVLVNQEPIKSNYKLQFQDRIEIEPITPTVLAVEPENIGLDIIYEDEAVLIVNKPRGLVVHPAPGNQQHTLVNAIMYHCRDRLSTINGVIRPGIVHRIDKDTSGLLIVCKNDKSHLAIAKQLKQHSIHRIYQALVYNNITADQGSIDQPIGRNPKDRKKMAVTQQNSKPAITHYRVLERLKEHRYTHVQLRLETGRTHQIRVHMTYIGNPLIGDKLYTFRNSKFAQTGQMLHAAEIGFIHPNSGQYMEFKVPPPADFSELLEKLKPSIDR